MSARMLANRAVEEIAMSPSVRMRPYIRDVRMVDPEARAACIKMKSEEGYTEDR